MKVSPAPTELDEDVSAAAVPQCCSVLLAVVVTPHKRLARLSRDNHVQPDGEDGTGEKKKKRSERSGKRAIKTTLAGCNLLDDSIGLCAAFHGTVDDLLLGELAHGGSVCTPSTEGKGPIASRMSRMIISYQRQKTRNKKKKRKTQYILGKIGWLQPPVHVHVGGPFVGRACLRFLLLLAHEARFGRPMTRVLCRLLCQRFFLSYVLLSRSRISLLLNLPS